MIYTDILKYLYAAINNDSKGVVLFTQSLLCCRLNRKKGIYNIYISYINNNILCTMYNDKL